MRLPGFTAQASYSSPFSGLKENYYYRSFMKSDVYLRQNIASSYIRNTRSRNRWKIIPEPQKEPLESGRAAWRALEKACDNLQCEECRKDCLRFINGLHDAINIKLGKPLRSPSDFMYLTEFVSEMNKHAFIGYRYR
jgi:hypothetical protein